MKPCIECGRVKALTEFYAHPQMADGHLGVCKDCHKQRMWRRRRTNPAVQAYDRARYQQPARKQRTADTARKWDEEHPAAYRAHYTLTNAVRDKRLKKGPCTICGTTDRVHGHHKDYSKPLDVTWLCARCHHRIHAAFPELGGHF
jgi:hypothetical protein